MCLIKAPQQSLNNLEAIKILSCWLSDREQVLAPSGRVLIVSEDSFGKQWMDSSLVCGKLIDSFEVQVIVVGFRAASLTKLAGRGLGMVPDRQTTGQLTLTTGEAGLGHRARLETSNVPFMSNKKRPQHHPVARGVWPSSPCTPLLILVKPIWRGAKEGMGEEERDRTVTNRKQVVRDESRRRCRGGRPFLSAQPLLSCPSRRKRWVRRRFPSPPEVRSHPAGAVIKLNGRLQTDRKERAAWKGPGGWPSHLQENRVRAATMSVCVPASSIWLLVLA